MARTTKIRSIAPFKAYVYIDTPFEEYGLYRYIYEPILKEKANEKKFNDLNKIPLRSTLMNYISGKISTKTMVVELTNYLFIHQSKRKLTSIVNPYANTSFITSPTATTAATLPPLKTLQSMFEKSQIQRSANAKMRETINPIQYHIPEYTTRNAELCIKLKKLMLNEPVTTMIRIKPIIFNLWLKALGLKKVFKNVSFACYIASLIRIAIKANSALRINYVRIPQKNSACLKIDGDPNKLDTTIKFSRHSADPVNFNIQQRNRTNPITCDDFVVNDSIYHEQDRNPYKINLLEVDMRKGEIYNHQVYWIKNQSAVYKFYLNDKYAIECIKMSNSDAKYIFQQSTRYDLLNVNSSLPDYNNRQCFAVLLEKYPLEFIDHACISCICCLKFIPNKHKNGVFNTLFNTIMANKRLKDMLGPKNYNTSDKDNRYTILFHTLNLL